MKPLKLNAPLPTKTLDHVKIAKFGIEDNPYLGQNWIEIWLIIGYLSDPADSNSFVQHVHPINGDPVYAYMKFEIGAHPLSPQTALGKRSNCGKWFQYISGNCDECEAPIGPYDGFLRMAATPSRSIGEGESDIEKSYNAVQWFLTQEEIPDPDTWENKKILDAVEWTP